MKNNLAVIILNYNSYDDTLKLINSIEQYDPGYSIIVVDNFYDNMERQKVLQLQEHCTLIFLEENNGYAAGNNAGIKKALELGCETFLLANSDTCIIKPNSISDCYSYMKKNHIGILGPKMINEAEEDISGCIKVDKFGRTSHLYTDEIKECMSLTGAFILIDKSVIEKIGYIREFYFLYREETDYCIRAFNNQVKIVFYPLVTILHKSGVTTKNVADYYYNRNMFIFSREIYNTNTLKLALFYFFRYVLQSLRILKNERAGKVASRKFKQIWLAYFDGVKDVRGKKQL